MKKILSLLLIIVMLTGCGKRTPKEEVEAYLKQYRNLSSEVLVDLESTIEMENLSNKQQDKYRNVLKKQYKDLNYEITKEEFKNDVAYVTAKIEVYDLYRAQKDASLYLQNNLDEFNDETGVYDVNKYLNYKLERMQMVTDRVEYIITFTVIKEDGEYVVSQPTEIDLQKIHGIYNYD